MKESFDIKAKPWKKSEPPKKVLFIRLQAMGDTVITLPYIAGFKKKYPDVSVEFLTRTDFKDIPKNLKMFDHVQDLKGERSTYRQLSYALKLYRILTNQKYDIVFDLQNNKVSKLIRRLVQPKAWVEFDRFSPNPAGDRTKVTINTVGLESIEPDFRFETKADDSEQILQSNGWNGHDRLIALNPAGMFETRNWPLHNYVELANLLDTQYEERVKFLILGTWKVKEKAAYFKEHLGDKLIDLSEKTTASQAFNIIKKTQLIITEDSGLMHMAWVQDVPTIALFGASRSDWSRPMGAHSILFDSSDLDCGNCMKEKCIHGDVRCLTRYSPQDVFESVMDLINPTLV